MGDRNSFINCGMSVGYQLLCSLAGVCLPKCGGLNENGSYVQMLGSRLVELFWQNRKRGLVRGGVSPGVGLDVSKSPHQAQSCSLCLLPSDEGVKLSAAAPVPYLSVPS